MHQLRCELTACDTSLRTVNWRIRFLQLRLHHGANVVQFIFGLDTTLPHVLVQHNFTIISYDILSHGSVNVT